MTTPMKCIVVDDSALSRKIVRAALESIEGVEILAVARDGLDAIERCKSLKPDFVTMDLEMPRMDGIEAVKELRRLCPLAQVVMVSSLTSAGAEITTRALQAGAFDFVLKPVSSNVDESIALLARQLSEKLEAVREQRRFGRPARPIEVNSPVVSTFVAPPTIVTTPPRANKPKPRLGEVRAICIGVSTGGPVALSTLIPRLPANLSVPVFVVQHMPPVFTKSLAQQLDRSSALTVVEAEDGMKAEAGTVYIAPGGRQMKVESNFVNTIVRVTDDPPVANAKPSVDYLFQSAAPLFGSKVIATILTGMGNDGLVGCREIGSRGGYVITQNAETCVVYGMPRCVYEAGLADEVLPLNDIAGALTKLSGEGAAVCR